MSISLTSSLTWVRRGVAAAHPVKYELDESELERVAKLARVKLDDARFELEAAEADEKAPADDGWEDEDESGEDDGDKMQGVVESTAKLKVDPDDLSAYNLDSYDDKPTDSTMAAFSNIRGLQFHRDAADDPYVSLDGAAEDEDQEREELEIYPTDSLLVAARTEDDVSQLDIYVYDDAQENLYVHHDLLLPAMPLCLEWIDYTPAPGEADGRAIEAGRPGNFVAVGTLDPEIEIWSLDVLEGLYPDAILGAPPSAPVAEPAPAPLKPGRKKPKKPKKVAPKPSAAFHTDSVLALSWNRTHRSLIGSASADTTVKLWDMSRPGDQGALRSFDLHTDKVQALEWNQAEPTIMLSGSWDHTVRVFDTRSPAAALGVTLESDVECVRWHSWASHEFFVSLDNGLVKAFDSRQLSSSAGSAPALWTLAAHDGAVAALDYSRLIPGFLVTGGVDGYVKLWNATSMAGGDAQRNISLIASRNLDVGKVFSATCCPDDATTVAVAGSKGSVRIWDTCTNAGVRKAFGDRLRALGKDVDRQRNPIVVPDDGDEEEESEGEAE